MRRFSFLKESIPKYLENPYITEVIITDETGEDYDLIKEHFSNPRLKVFRNEKQLGSFENKQRAASYATSDYICLLDSDNFADIEYFEAFKKYITTQHTTSRDIYFPSFAMPDFDYRQFIGVELTKSTTKSVFCDKLDLVLNTMNCILSRKFWEEFRILHDHPWCDKAHGSFDALYFSLYSIYQMNARIIVVSDMYYHHRVHDGSTYLQNIDRTRDFKQELYSRYFNSQHRTLVDWQNSPQDISSYIVQASSMKCDDAWMEFPIGMQYSFPKKAFDVGTHDRLVFCGITSDTDATRRPIGKNRRSILDTLSKNGIQNVWVSPTEYFEILPSYKFVISPEGNGIDCHRHYEALMAGCIPIVERNPMIEKKYAGCPILYTDDYSEITESYLVEKYEEMKYGLYHFSALNINSYKNSEYIKECGNFWMKRLTGESWYKPLVTVRLMGGLGNQLFQLAFLHKISKASNRIPFITNINQPSRHTDISYFNTIFQKWNQYHMQVSDYSIVQDPISILNGLPKSSCNFNGGNVFDFFMRELDTTKKPVMFEGYFQYYTYIEPSFIETLTFSEDCLKKHPNISSMIFLHFRGGDYKGIPEWNIDLTSYYQKAIQYFPNAHFAIFTNDKECLFTKPWIHNIKYTLIEENEIDSLYLMSKCMGGICANSTFSWWGAVMNPLRKLILPLKWNNRPEFITSGYHFSGGFWI